MHRQSPAAALPLSNHVVLASNNLDCARDQVARKFCAHRLDRLNSAGRFDARHHRAPGRMFSLNFIRYGATVTIEPGELTSFYLIQMPLAGRAEITNGHRHVLSDPGTGSVLNANRHTTMRWHKGCEQALIQIDRAALETFAETLLGHRLCGPIIFDPVLKMSGSASARFRAHVSTLFRAAEDGTAFGPSPSLQQMAIEQEFLDQFLRSQPSNIRHFFNEPDDQPKAAKMRRAIEFIHANLHRPVTMIEVAESGNIAPRSLQLAFRQAYGYTAKEFLYRERLKRARHDLIMGDSDQSVASIAARWGIAHSGRFAAAYYAAFGEYPGETLRFRF